MNNIRQRAENLVLHYTSLEPIQRCNIGTSMGLVSPSELSQSQADIDRLIFQRAQEFSRAQELEMRVNNMSGTNRHSRRRAIKLSRTKQDRY